MDRYKRGSLSKAVMVQSSFVSVWTCISKTCRKWPVCMKSVHTPRQSLAQGTSGQRLGGHICDRKVPRGQRSV
ncbi:hypothetical protein C8R48DRAFT_377098 [Suillus tomentosus]|nr:hypothetical protein C8R48DRAFT_377098 [Suillus tomentosus]